MNKNFLIALTSILFFSSCNFNYTDQDHESDSPETEAAFSMSKSALKFVQHSEWDSLIHQFEPAVLARINPEELSFLLKEGKKIIENSAYPQDSCIIQSQSVNYSFTGKSTVNMFSYPFQNLDYADSVKYFHITIADMKIHRLLLNDHPPGRRIIEPSHTEPHKTSLNLQTDSLRWFRIWYNGGVGDNKTYGDDKGYYAVSGGLKKLKEIKAEDKLQRTFDLINKAEIDSLDFQFMRDREVGDPEWIHLRMKFDGEYKEFDEFEISYFINEEEGKKEVMSDYIVLKHSDKTRYLLKTTENEELVIVLTQIARSDFDGFYE